MKKQDLIKALAAQAGVSLDAAAKVLGAFIDTIVDELKRGGEVNITGFGAFRVSHRKARTGVNPKTLEKIQIPAQKSPTFKPGKTFKDSIR